MVRVYLRVSHGFVGFRFLGGLEVRVRVRVRVVYGCVGFRFFRGLEGFRALGWLGLFTVFYFRV